MPKKVVLSGYYGFDNFGDEAILSVLCKMLKKENADITVLSANPEKTKKLYNVNTVKNFDIKNLIKIISKSDILISGGGSLLQDVTSFKSLFYYSLVIFTALFFRKKVVIFAQGIGPLNKPFSKLLVKSLLKHAQYISVRDEKSLELMKKWNLKAYLVNDPVFSVDVPLKNTTGKIGIQLRDFSTMNDNLLENLSKSIAENFSDKKIQLLVFQEALDFEVCRKFQTLLKDINPAIETEILCGLNRDEFINEIADLEYLIAMRFHALIVALKAGVPSIGINYDIKVQKLANEANIPLISMDGQDDINKVLYQMKTLNPDELRAFADLKSSIASETAPIAALLSE